MNLAFITDLIFPSRCLGCRTITARNPRRKETCVLCDRCRSKIPLHPTLFCATCRARLPYGEKICHRTAAYVLGAATNYQNEIAERLIKGLKFEYIRDAARPLASLLFEYLERLSLQRGYDVIVPVPLSSERERTRGFNQARLIAAELGKLNNLAVESNALVRTRHTKTQSELSGIRDREENVRGAFRVLYPELVARKRVLLVDDVATSGATLSEASKALKQAGAKFVIGLVVAKA